MSAEHQRLLTILPTRPEDYDPWGQNIRWSDPQKPYPDCSGGCRFARWLEDIKGTDAYLSMDWCVCTNPASHRVGLLTFEHQGCEKYEREPFCPDCEEDLPDCVCGNTTLAEPGPEDAP